MVEEVTIDPSVLVSAFVKGDKLRPEARQVMKRIFSGEYLATTSSTGFIEVCGSVSRRTSLDDEIAVRDQLMKWEDMNLITYSN